MFFVMVIAHQNKFSALPRTRPHCEQWPRKGLFTGIIGHTPVPEFAPLATEPAGPWRKCTHRRNLRFISQKTTARAGFHARPDLPHQLQRCYAGRGLPSRCARGQLPFQGMQPEGIDKTQRMRRIPESCRTAAAQQELLARVYRSQRTEILHQHGAGFCVCLHKQACAAAYTRFLRLSPGPSLLHARQGRGLKVGGQTMLP
jgi:hypothetical protein